MAGLDSPADRAIAAFGSIDALAKAIGVLPKRIHGWRASIEQKGAGGRIPAKHQGEILKAARERDIALTAEDLIDMRDAPETASEAEVAP